MPNDNNIVFGPNAKSSDVTPYSLGVLRDVMTAANVAKLTISSTQRSPADQARVMFNNLETQGVAAQRRLYKPPGQAVIDVYVAGKAAGKTSDAIKAEMTAKINELGPMTVSHHAADPKVLNVFDVAPSSVADVAAFQTAAKNDARVSKFLTPPNDPGLHFEIPQPQDVA
ncbi:MAG TPA: hypothetical protein VGQ46_16495 [Thermoanaerobaculia bacterium]|jgi:hypothetical protein|nr:hypothetical protein [Thermoanaerobaculia bacterium]